MVVIVSVECRNGFACCKNLMRHVANFPFSDGVPRMKDRKLMTV